jgi:type III pantothenate kinase
LSLLLIDIGNTRVKWARLVNGKMSPQQAAANAGWTAADYARRVIGSSTDRIVVSSVAGDEVNRALTEAAAKVGAPTPEFVASERTAAGITTDYIDPWRLGVDRFVAAIGAHHLSSGQPVCVVNIGTAMTIDLIDGSGRHRGGAIVPGPALMVSSLLAQTNGIRRRAKGGPDGATGMFAKTTRNAIGEGARYAAAGVIDRALEEARFLVGTRPLVILSGGGSVDIKPLIRSTCVSLPDLVLHGLAVWAHQTPTPPRSGLSPSGGSETPRKQRPENHRKRQTKTASQHGTQTSGDREPTFRKRQAETLHKRTRWTSPTLQADTASKHGPRTSRKRRPVV